MSSDAAARAATRTRRNRGRQIRRRRIVALVALALVVATVPAAYSYVTTMLQPSSLPLTIRTVEWVRDHHGAWLVNAAERYYYSWTAPKKGEPPLISLPAVGVTGSHASLPKDRLVYGPPPIRPVIVPALEREGVWRPAGVPVNGGSPVLVTVFRPEPDFPRILAYVAWIDTARTQLALYPGRYEPPSGSPRGPMAVPFGERSRLLATFNSAFKHKDGRGGFAVNGHVYEPLRNGMATLVGYRDGHVDIVAWRGGPTPRSTIVLARQNLPLIVNGGKPNPSLRNDSLWGYTLGNSTMVWRTGIGVDAKGNLIYLAAPDQTAQSLATALAHAGAVRAMELDINAEWPSFMTYRQPGARRAVKLVPNLNQPATRYLVPDDRDFFAVYERRPGQSFAVPFK